MVTASSLVASTAVAAAALFFRSSFFTVAVPLSVNAIEAVRPTTTIRQVSGGDRHLNFHDYRVNSDLHQRPDGVLPAVGDARRFLADGGDSGESGDLEVPSDSLRLSAVSLWRLTT